MNTDAFPIGSHTHFAICARSQITEYEAHWDLPHLCLVQQVFFFGWNTGWVGSGTAFVVYFSRRMNAPQNEAKCLYQRPSLSGILLL